MLGIDSKDELVSLLNAIKEGKIHPPSQLLGKINFSGLVNIDKLEMIH